MMKIYKMFALALLAFIVFTSAMVEDLNGVWVGRFNLPNGQSFPVKYTFKVEGEKLTGTMDGPEGSAILQNGKIVGKEFSLSIKDPDKGTEVLQTGKYYGDSTTVDTKLGNFTIHTKLLRGK